MWTFGTAVDPQRPKCQCLVALPGILNPTVPQCVSVIDVSQWPHWMLWGYILVGIDPGEEPALMRWKTQHPDD